MKNKKRFYVLYLLLILCGAVFAQVEQPVKLSVEHEIDSALVELKVEFLVDSSWIVYDSIADEGGPIPVSFRLTDGVGREVNFNQVKPQMKKKFDDLFMMDIYYFENKATYVLSCDRKQASANRLQLEVEYMTCNLTSGVCLPPTSHLFTIDMQ